MEMYQLVHSQSSLVWFKELLFCFVTIEFWTQNALQNNQYYVSSQSVVWRGLGQHCHQEEQTLLPSSSGLFLPPLDTALLAQTFTQPRS